MHSANPAVPSALCFFYIPAIVLPFPSQMGGASSYSTQFLSHSSPRGPPPGMVSSRPGPPPTTGGLYPSHPAQTQKMSQHGGYPGAQQGLKRAFHSEVSEGGGSHEWVCVDALKMQKAFVYLSIRLFPCTGVVSSGKQQTHYSMKNICKLLYYSIYIALLYYSIYIIIFQANILWFLLLKYEDLLLFSDCKLNMFEFWTKHLKTKHLRAVEELWWTFVSIFWHLQTKRLFEEKNGISTNNENIINVQYCRL